MRLLLGESFMLKSFTSLLVLLIISFAFAFPPFEQYNQGSFNIRIPANWTVNADEAKSTIYIVEDPASSTSPAIFFTEQANINNLSPQAVIEQTINGLINSGFSNYQLISSQNIEGGLSTIFSGYMQNQFTKVGLIVFGSQNSLTMAMFSAEANRFDELGGIALIYVTVGGYDPSEYTNSQQNQNTSGNNSACFDPNDYSYEYNYCKFARAKAQNITVESNYIVGDWSNATGLPLLDTYENETTGEISQDSIGSGITIAFHPNGRYDIIYLSTSTVRFCTNTIKGFENGQYSFDGKKIKLYNASYEASSSYCGGPYKPFTEKLIDNIADFAYIDQNAMFIQLDCNLRDYMIDCDGFGNSIEILQRKR